MEEGGQTKATKSNPTLIHTDDEKDRTGRKEGVVELEEEEEEENKKVSFPACRPLSV